MSAREQGYRWTAKWCWVKWIRFTKRNYPNRLVGFLMWMLFLVLIARHSLLKVFAALRHLFTWPPQFNISDCSIFRTNGIPRNVPSQASSIGPSYSSTCVCLQWPFTKQSYKWFRWRSKDSTITCHFSVFLTVLPLLPTIFWSLSTEKNSTEFRKNSTKGKNKLVESVLSAKSRPY